jgi:type II secretory pathway component PulF
LLVVSLAALIVIVVVLVPNLEPLFEGSGAEPPPLVAVLMGLSHFLSGSWVELVVALAAATLLSIWAYRQPAARTIFDRWQMKLPFFGSLAALSDSSRFCRALASLLRSGSPLLQAMEAAGNACRNPSSREMIKEACRDVSSGRRLAAALEKFTPMTTSTRQLIAIGEEANRLEDMLLHAAKSDEATVFRRVERAMTLLTPAMTLMIGGLVGGLIVSVMRAILSVNDLALQ